MSRPAISVENLSKVYRIGAQARKAADFRDAMSAALMAPWNRLRRLGEAPEAEEELFWALKDVSFEVAPGEVVGIIGRNGAGKSTLLKVLSRITEPTAGCVRIRGRVASLLEVGTGFHPELTGRENIYLNGSILGMRRAEIARKFDEVVEFAEVKKFLDTPVKFYSSGMYIRLAFAVAAHLEPEILIVDEVLAVGDAAFQQKCLGKMGEVTKEGRTVLFVSHTMPTIRSLCKTACVMEGGRLGFRGDVAEGVARYLRQLQPTEARTRAEFDSPGPDRPWMTSADLQIDGDTPGSILMGERVRMTVRFACPGGIRYPRLTYKVLNDEGRIVLGGSNRYQPSNELAEPAEDGSIACDLGVLPLTPGRYSIALYFGDMMTDRHIVEDALGLEVVENDAWGRGRFPPNDGASIWWPTRFEVAGTPG